MNKKMFGTILITMSIVNLFFNGLIFNRGDNILYVFLINLISSSFIATIGIILCIIHNRKQKESQLDNKYKQHRNNFKKNSTNGRLIQNISSIVTDYENEVIGYAKNSFLSCKDAIMQEIYDFLSNLNEGNILYDDIIVSSHTILNNVLCNILSSRKFHIYDGTLSSKGKTTFKIFIRNNDWLLSNKHISQEEYDTNIEKFRDDICNNSI